MAKIARISKKSFADIMKQKKFEKAQLAKEKEIAVQKAKDLEFDTFVRNTARDMLKGSPRYELKVFDVKDTSVIPNISSDRSVWAPWSKLFNK